MGVYGFPLGGGRGAGKVAITDDDVADTVSGYSWCLAVNGYPVARVKGSQNHIAYLHNVVLERLGVEIAAGMCVDHINRNRLDNRARNLRVVSYAENSHNRDAFGASRYKGVSLDRRRVGRSSPWSAECGRNGRRIRSQHPSELEAARAYDRAAIELYGPDAWTNARAGLFEEVA